MRQSPTMSLPHFLRSAPLVDLGLLAAAGFALGALEPPLAWAGLLAGGIAMPRLGLAHRKALRRKATLRRLVAERRQKRQTPAPSKIFPSLGDGMKAPLNAIIGYATLLGDEPQGPLNPVYAEYAHAIATASHKLKAQVDALLDLERIGAHQLQLVEQETDAAELAHVAVRLCQPQARAAGVLVAFDPPPIVHEIKGDMARLQQGLTNLLLAAIALTPPQNCLRLHTMPTPNGGFAFLVETGTTHFFPNDITLSLTQALAELHGGTLILQQGAAQLTLPAHRLKKA